MTAAARQNVVRHSVDDPLPLHVAVDIVVCTVLERRLRVLLVERRSDPCAGMWALPGGFTRPEESIDETARRTLAEQTGVAGVWLEQLATYDNPGGDDPGSREPRWRVVSVAYLALIDSGRVTDAGTEQSRWWPVDALPGRLAFEHDSILADGVARLRAKTRYAPVAFQLLGGEFTIPELQTIYEAVVGEALDPRNFRRDLRNAGVIEPTGTTRKEGRGRPATLYRYVPGEFALDAVERRVAGQIRGARA